MARIDLKNKAIQAKLVYYGPGLCGKTTNLQYINKTMAKGQELMSLSTEGDRTIFFDFMPFDLGKLRGLDVQFKLYTVPGQVRYNQTRKMVLKNVDGVVFVADSQAAMIDANLESLDNLYANLKELGIDAAIVPIVLQYNKRDLPDVMPIDELDRALNAKAYPTFTAAAASGEGVVETLKEACKRVLVHLARSLPGRDEDAAPIRPPSNGSNRAQEPTAASPAVAAPEAAPASREPTPSATASSPALVTPPESQARKPGSEPLTKADLAELTSVIRALAHNARAHVGEPQSSDRPSNAAVQEIKREIEELRRAQASRATRDALALDSALRKLAEAAASRSDFEQLETRVEALATKADLTDLTTLVRSLAEAPHDSSSSATDKAVDGSILQAVERLGVRHDLVRAELEALRKQLSPPLDRQDVAETIGQALERVATRQDLDGLSGKLQQIAAPQQAPDTKLLEAVATLERSLSAKLAALSERLEGLPTARDILSLQHSLERLVERVDARLAAAMTSEPSERASEASRGGGGTEPPVMMKPAPEPAAAVPAPAEPVSAEPEAAEPIAAEPHPAEPIAAETAAAEPVAAEAEPVAVEPQPAEPVAAETAAAEPLAAEPAAVEQSTTEQAAIEEPATEQAATEQSPTEQSAVDQPAVDQPAVDHPSEAAEETVDEKPVAEEPPAQQAYRARADGPENPTQPSFEAVQPVFEDDPAQQNAARVARVMVADLYLYNKEQVEEGIRHGDFFERNKEALDDMRLTYESRIPADVRSRRDHLKLAIETFIDKKRKQLGL